MQMHLYVAVLACTGCVWFGPSYGICVRSISFMELCQHSVIVASVLWNTRAARGGERRKNWGRNL